MDPGLGRACKNEDEDELKSLLDSGFDVNIRDDLGQTALIIAVNYLDDDKRLECMRLLLDRGADVNGKNKCGETALMLAVSCLERDKCLQCITLLLNHGADVNIRNTNGETALMFAIRSLESDKCLQCIQLLLDHGADVNIRNPYYGDTALMVAVLWLESDKDLQCIQLLLDHGADVNIRNPNGDTALMLAVRSLEREKFLQCIQLLLDHDADVNIRNPNGETVLIFAVRRLESDKDLQCITLLLDHGADVNIQDSNGNTALILAARNRNGNFLLKSVRMILDRCAKLDINEKVRESATHSLKNASKNRNIKLDTINSEGKCALAIALENYDETSLNVVEALLQAGSDPNLEVSREALLQAGSNPNLEVSRIPSLLNIAVSGSSRGFEKTRLMIAHGAKHTISTCPTLENSGRIFSPLDVAVLKNNFRTAHFLLTRAGCLPSPFFYSNCYQPFRQENQQYRSLPEPAWLIAKMEINLSGCPQWVEMVRNKVSHPEPLILKHLCASVILKSSRSQGDIIEGLKEYLPDILAKFVMFDNLEVFNDSNSRLPSI